MTPPTSADVVLLGCGGAGLAILHQLAVRAANAPARRPLRVTVVDPVNRLRAPKHDRTWCFWLPSRLIDDGWVGAIAAARWQHLQVLSYDGVEHVWPHPLEYVMVTSDAYAQLVEREVAASPLELTWLEEPAGSAVTGRWTFDSRPRPVGPVGMWQHFVGEFRRFYPGTLDPARAVLMDFRMPQPAQLHPGGSGTAFGYLLPLSDETALVEYTQFTPAPFEAAQFQAGLDAYLGGLDLGTSSVLHAEHGSIPMSAQPFRPRLGPGRFAVGTAGGATRASTGYTFAGMQRQAAGIAQAVLAGREPCPARPHPRRHHWLDAVMLEALHDDRRGITGAEFFPAFFARNPGARALGFLDGTTSMLDDARVIAATPPRPMLAAAGRLALAQLTR